MRTAICEDEEKDALLLRRFVEASTNALVDTFKTGRDFLDSSPWGRYDVVFMDVYLGDMSGVDVARSLRDRDDQAALVFTTSSEEYALDAYHVNAIQYLVKPIEEKFVVKVLQDILLRMETAKEAVCAIIVNRIQQEIPMREILYVEASGRGCLVHTTQMIFKTSMSVNEIEKLLHLPNFLRCHRAYIVNLKYVQEMGRDFLMKNGEVVYIRKGDAKKCSDAYKIWLTEETWRSL